MGKGVVLDRMRCKSWIDAVSIGWGAVSASELLDVNSVSWSSLRLPAPTHDECISFAAIERALKYGQSVAVSLSVSENTLARLVVYLHRLRFDAMQGGIRTPGLNSGTSLSRKDIVCITRPSAAIKAMSIIPNVSAHVIKRNSQPLSSVDKRQDKGRTALVDGSLNPMELIEIVESRTRPLAFIIDGTRGGYEHADQLDLSIYECFPEVPRVILLSLGDEQAAQRVRNNRSSTHLWITRLADTSAVFAEYKLPTLRLEIVKDDVVSTHLSQIGRDLFNLRKINEQLKDPILKDKLQALNRVCRSLGELAQPLSYLESILADRTRPGLFPIRTLGRWLETVVKDSCKYGEQQHQAQTITQKLNSFYALLLQGTTGKTGFIQSKALHALTTGRSLMMLVGTHHEADGIEIWFDKILPLYWDENNSGHPLITVNSMDGVRAYRQPKVLVDDVIILGLPWENRQYWLTTPCETLSLVCYEHEQKWYEKTIQQWWLSAGAPSQNDGDKFRFWTLNWTPKIVDKPSASNSDLSIVYEKHNNLGEYPIEQRILSFAIDTNVDDWLEVLIKDAIIEPRNSSEFKDPIDEFALIYTDKNQSPIPWAIHRNILVLGDEKISNRRPDTLKVGDQVILLKHSTERLATQESLFELLLESEGMRQLIRLAKQWNEIIDQVYLKSKGKISDIKKLLDREGVDVGEEAIKGWIDHRVIGPQNTDRVISIFAKHLKLEHADNRTKIIVNAIKKIRSLHQQLGQELRKALIAGAAKSSAIRIGDHLIEKELLDEMIDIQTIVSIQLPGRSIIPSIAKAETLQSILEDIMSGAQNKLLFTTPALKSLRDCGFQDAAIFKTCLTLMATKLHEFYVSKESRMFEVLAHFSAVEIEFQPKLSAITMGKYTDSRQYKNRSADLDKHFKLGSGRDPKHTMRIHFEWDEEVQLIVVHHAGRHLESSQS